MYILIELVPVAAGTGFGVFCCGLFGLVFLFIMAQYAMTWMLAPAAIVMTLLQHETLWWILPTLFVVGALVNWFFAKKMGNAWCPLMPILLTLTLESIFWVGGMIIGLIIELISKHFPAEELWTLLGLPIAIAFYALLFYPLFNMLIAASSVTTLLCGYKPCLGALASFVGMVGGALCIQGLVEVVGGWFGESSYLENIHFQLDANLIKLSVLYTVDIDEETIFPRLQGIIDTVKVIPAGLRFLLGLAAVIGGGFCEHQCSGGNSLFS
ncbi:MAG: hypothetical protein UIE84_05100 [Christensenellales bacterium]|nr:hypothetical protein [Christensenellales bacterium]